MFEWLDTIIQRNVYKVLENREKEARWAKEKEEQSIKFSNKSGLPIELFAGAALKEENNVLILSGDIYPEQKRILKANGWSIDHTEMLESMIYIEASKKK